MQITGTNELMDLWADIQMLKNWCKSDRSKELLAKKYIAYVKLGGKNTDKEIEKWIHQI